MRSSAPIDAAGGWAYTCAWCGTPHPPSHVDYCRACGSPVVAERREFPARVGEPYGRALGEGPRGSGIWRYADHLPLERSSSWLSMGEGMTPVVSAPALAERVGAGEVWLLLDHLEPTGSFKDRAAAAGVAHAVAHKMPAVVCASSGNAAASAAAYAARAGLRAVIMVPEATPPGKLAAISAHGPVVLAVPGDYSHSFALARRLCDESGLTNLATTYVNPVAVAALRSVAFDLYEQLRAPIDWVHVPTGSGPLAHGVAAGARDLVRLGLATTTPRLVVDQAAGCAPIAEAFARGAPEVSPWGEVTTGVSGINDPLRGYVGDGTLTLREVRASGGCAQALPDGTILEARRLLAEDHGIFVEPAAAASVAGLLRLGEQGAYDSDHRVVCLLTGHGLKTASASVVEVPVVARVEDAVDVLAKAGLT
ncbi:MAG TPA: pyridoxal-phosphate dependent enzyme [Actinopolymorphaceae bacterium]